MQLLILVAVIAVIYTLYKAGKLVKGVTTGVQDVLGVGAHAETLKNAADKAIAKVSASDKKNPFSPNYVTQFYPSSTAGFTGVNTAKMLAKKIHEWNSIQSVASYFPNNNNYTEIQKAIETCKYKTQVSYVAREFQKLYGTDMLKWIRNSLYNIGITSSNDQKKMIVEIIDYVNNLPTGKL